MKQSSEKVRFELQLHASGLGGGTVIDPRTGMAYACDWRIVFQEDCPVRNGLMGDPRYLLSYGVRCNIVVEIDPEFFRPPRRQRLPALTEGEVMDDPYSMVPYGDVLNVPPAPPELEEEWLAEARQRLSNPDSDAPAVKAYLCGCIHARRLLYHEEYARRILQELSVTDPRPSQPGEV